MKTNFFASIAQPSPDTDFRLLLQAELARRCADNSQYSLRAFAKFLGLDHATLSQLLRGKRRLTRRTIVRLGTKLGLTRDKLDRYSSREESITAATEPPTHWREVQQMAQDTAAVISEWRHYAILELTRLPDFRPDSRWIARVLGLSPDEINIAISRLVRLGLLEMVTRQLWVDRSGDTTATLAEFAQVSIDRLAANARALMHDADGSAPNTVCIHSATTLALPVARLAALRDRIAKFQRELSTLLNQEGACDDVFQLEISLFPITNLSQIRENKDG